MKRMRLFKTSTTLAATALSIFLLAACSSDDNVVAEGEKIEISGEQFTFTTEDFGAEENLTRATVSAGIQSQAAANAKPQTIDLGDGITAEVSIEPDTKAPTTRATKPISDGHYTIYAIDNATNTRLTGADKLLKGTVSGGHFTKDAGTRLKLDPGTYTFVCFNDAVTDNGTSLTISNGADALIGVAPNEAISGTDYQVNFTMKHQTARIRFNIVSYTNEGTGVTASLTSAGTYTTAQSYPVDASLATPTTTAVLSKSQTFPTSGTVVNSPLVKTYNNATDYNYLLPGVAVNDLTLSFTAGSIYGKSLAGKTLALTNATSTLAANHSYTINVKLKTFPYYLFEDGTVGALGDKGSRTPIGIVIDEKTATDKGVAIALTDDGAMYSPERGYYFYWIGGDDGTLNNMQGYDITWTKNYWSADASAAALSTTPAESSSGTAYYAAAHYVPLAPITGTNIDKWFLPSAGYWKKALVKLGELNEAGMPSNFDGAHSWMGGGPTSGTPVAWNSTKMATYFTQAGGTLPLVQYDMSGTNGSNRNPVYVSLTAANVYWQSGFLVAGESGHARAFVFF